MTLKALQLDNAKPNGKTQRLYDGQGLYLEISPTGGKYWRLKYRFNDKEKRLSFGGYPLVKLAEARLKRDEAKKLLLNNIDPSVIKREAKTAALEATKEVDLHLFEPVAMEWFNNRKSIHAESYNRTVIGRLRNDAFPHLGNRPIAEIRVPEILACVKRLCARGANESAHRLLRNIGQVFEYARINEFCASNPVPGLSKALKPVKVKHMAAITDPKEIGGLLRSIDTYSGTFVVQCALKLAPLTFVRPSELRCAEWKEIDFNEGIWCIPASKMKMGEPLIVPLSRQAIEIIKELHPLTGNGKYIFPGARTADRPLSNNAILSALRRMGYEKEEMTGHGFRAMARTILEEVLEIPENFIEQQLAHKVKDANGRAYNRTKHLAKRKEMMQIWADYLDRMKLT